MAALRRFASLGAGLAALGYGGSTAYLKVNEKDLVYHPAERAVSPSPAQFGLAEERVAYASADGTKLTAWIIRAPAADTATPWMLICHGNYGNIGYGQRPEYYSFARDLGLNLLAFDYRGYGESEGSPSEDGLYADALVSYRYLTDSLRIAPDRIILFGHSLGSGVAIDLATQVPAAALAVEGAYTSVPDRGQELYPWLPVKLVASQRFASIEKVGHVRLPKLFLHSPEDDIIPFAHGERLFAAAGEPKRLVRVAGGHMDAYKLDSATYFGALRELIAATTR